MNEYRPEKLSRRERQIMDILFARGEASALDVQEEMEDAPGYSAVRALLRLLEEKGHISHRKSGRKYLFKPLASHSTAQSNALKNVLNTFFANSAERAVASLLDMQDGALDDEDYDRLSALIENARKKK